MRSRSLRRDLASALGYREWLEYLGWQRGLEKGQMGQRKLSHEIGDRAWRTAADMRCRSVTAMCTSPAIRMVYCIWPRCLYVARREDMSIRSMCTCRLIQQRIPRRERFALN